MRAVAILLPALLLVAVMPATAASNDECASTCVPVTAPRPTGSVPAVTYYVWYGTSACDDLPGGPFSLECKGSGRVLGVLYEETNGLGGLQRKGIVLDKPYPADKAVLL